jgi:hypothetical protein
MPGKDATAARTMSFNTQSTSCSTRIVCAA